MRKGFGDEKSNHIVEGAQLRHQFHPFTLCRLHTVAIATSQSSAQLICAEQNEPAAATNGLGVSRAVRIDV